MVMAGGSSRNCEQDPAEFSYKRISDFLLLKEGIELGGNFSCYKINDAIKFNMTDILRIGLSSLPHRGEDSFGGVYPEDEYLFVSKGIGPISIPGQDHRVFISQADFKSVTLGHTRRSHVPLSNWEWDKAQPIFQLFGDSYFAIAKEGFIAGLKKPPEKTETQMLAAEISKYSNVDIEEAVKKVIFNFPISYCLNILSENRIIAYRDPLGIYPLCIGEKYGNFFVSSESAAFAPFSAKFKSDVTPGEMIVIDKKGIKRKQIFKPRPSLCIFEFIYFSRPDSHLYGESVGLFRINLGRKLAQKWKNSFDIVVPLRESSYLASSGYAEELGIVPDFVIVRDRSYFARQEFAKHNISDFHPIKEVVKGKKVVAVADCVIHGNNTRRKIEALRGAEAREIHLRVASPPPKFQCCYGKSAGKRLIAQGRDYKEMKEFLKVDSLEFLDLEDLKDVGAYIKQCCTGCIDGNFPISLKDIQAGKFTLERM